MKTFQLTGRPNELYFENKQRRDESAIFSEVLDILSRHCTMSDIPLNGPLEDVRKGTVEGSLFEVVNDIDWGVFLRADSEDTISKLKGMFE